jgi:hypothetical protein
MSMSWDEYFDNVKKENQDSSFEERCHLLEVVRSGFDQNISFASMELGLRKTIAGLPNKYIRDDLWWWFGSMRGAGKFHHAVNENDPHLSSALESIPNAGEVSYSQYKNYLSEFTGAFPKGGDGVAVASRLLAMKRPDQFVCRNSRNQSKLCKGFGINGDDYEPYWEITMRIMNSIWWKSDAPTDRVEHDVWDARAAMLDAICYQEIDTVTG